MIKFLVSSVLCLGVVACGPAFTTEPAPSPEASSDVPDTAVGSVEAPDAGSPASPDATPANPALVDSGSDSSPTPPSTVDAGEPIDAPTAPVCTEGAVQCTTNGLGTATCVQGAWQPAACGTDETCTDGACACPDGTEACGGGCINVQAFDHDNCGGCGIQCSRTASCVSGVCRG